MRTCNRCHKPTVRANLCQKCGSGLANKRDRGKGIYDPETRLKWYEQRAQAVRKAKRLLDDPNRPQPSLPRFKCLEKPIP